MSDLVELSKSLAALVERAAPSVVRVDAGHPRGASGVVWSSDGLIVAADHKIQREEDLEIGLPGGAAVKAKLLGRDPGSDLALLKVDASGLPALAWAPLAEIKVGHLALAVARPGRTARAALGVIHALGNEPWRTPQGGKLAAYVETDLGGHAGFSGGPLLAADGRGIGINTGGILRGTSLTVPAETVTRVIGAILDHGGPRRGYLGVAAQPVRLPPPIAEARKQAAGLLILGVQAEGPAERAGLLLGDTIVGVDGKPIEDLGDLQAALEEERIGKEVQLAVLRAGKIEERPVTIGTR